jgi:ClpP class serine protease
VFVRKVLNGFIEICGMVNQIWAIEPIFLNGIDIAKLARHDGKLPRVNMINAVNYYTPKELGYMGIATAETKTGLVAVIPVSGILTPDWEYYDGTSTKWLINAIKIADENTNIKAIVLNTDSPGGTVAGTESFAKAVADCVKPIIGFAESQAASAAYWAISQCDELWIGNNKITGLGSIGTIWEYRSYAESFKMAGIDVKVLRNPNDKALGHMAEPINEDVVKEMEGLMSVMTETFLGAVQKARPAVKADIGGKMYYGQNTIKMGLADRVGSLTDVVKRADYLGK